MWSWFKALALVRGWIGLPSGNSRGPGHLFCCEPLNKPRIALWEAPMNKRVGPPRSVYRYGGFLRFSLERGFIDGPLWSLLVCLPCLLFLR